MNGDFIFLAWTDRIGNIQHSAGPLQNASVTAIEKNRRNRLRIIY